VPTGLILLQPDFGTAMLVDISGAFVLISRRAAGGGGSARRSRRRRDRAGCVVLAAAPYQKDRILTFLNPESDPLGTGWNIIQSKIAIGAGGFHRQGLGRGLAVAPQLHPEHTTDFISRC
jgi:rod shape determining protein RodA